MEWLFQSKHLKHTKSMDMNSLIFKSRRELVTWRLANILGPLRITQILLDLKIKEVMSMLLLLSCLSSILLSEKIQLQLLIP